MSSDSKPPVTPRDGRPVAPSGRARGELGASSAIAGGELEAEAKRLGLGVPPTRAPEQGGGRQPGDHRVEAGQGVLVVANGRALEVYDTHAQAEAAAEAHALRQWAGEQHGATQPLALDVVRARYTVFPPKGGAA